MCIRDSDRAAPHNGVFLVLHQQVDAHYINAHTALDGPAALVVRHGTAMNAEQLGDGRAGDIGIQSRMGIDVMSINLLVENEEDPVVDVYQRQG